MKHGAQTISLNLTSPEATARTAQDLGAVLRPGDVLLLSGQIGAGKTHFARSLIQSLQQTPEDVPSPTFTLVQTYETPLGEIWHADLYRLTSPEECVELGLTEAFESAICLVEWPDRLGEDIPDTALHMAFGVPPAGPDPAEEDNRRTLQISWQKPDWTERLHGILCDTAGKGDGCDAGWEDAERLPLAGDASTRSYTRLTRGTDTAILMEDPDGNPAHFARLARYLGGLGLSAPRIYAEAPHRLLLEDLGDGLLARLVTDAASETRLYRMAVDALVALHGHMPPADLPTATPKHLAQAVDLAFVHYAALPDLLEPVTAAFLPILQTHAAPQDVLVLRDFHAENILSLPGRTGAARAGLLDFQDALIGHPAYDLVSLCRDPRRDLFPETEAQCIAAYLAATDEPPEAFHTAYAVLGVQRNLRILGIFARLAATRGKPHYLAYLPRTWAHLQDQLAHPVLAPLRPLLAELPAPDAAHLDRLRSLCPTP